MIQKSYSYFIWFIVLIISACNSNESPLDTTQAAVYSAEITSTQSLSQHFVELRFDTAVSTDAISADDISIVSGTGQKLAIKDVAFYDDGRGAVLETEPQDPLLYTMILNSEKSPSSTGQRAVTREVVGEISSTITFTTADNFIGSTGPEPFVSTVVALSNTSVLITMDRDMDPDFAELTSAYRILVAVA